MGNFNRDHFGGNRGGYQGRGRSSFGGGGRNFGKREDRPMYKAVCSNCGKECEVPFRPTGDKPVYCSECFEKMGNRSFDSPRSDRSDFRRPNFDQNKSQFDAISSKLEGINQKLEKIVTLLEPKVAAPVSTAPTIEKAKEPKTPKVKKASKKKASIGEK